MLKSANIYLRKVEKTDVKTLLEWENNPENWEVSDTTKPYTEADMIDFVNSPQDLKIAGQLRLMICLNQVKKPIGAIDLFQYDENKKEAGVGVLINDKANRKKGYANEALGLLVEYCFTQLDMEQLFCHIFESNNPSIRLFEKNGFVQKGKRNRSEERKTEIENELFYELTKEN